MLTSASLFDGTVYRYVQRLDGFVSADFDAAGGRLSSRCRSSSTARGYGSTSIPPCTAAYCAGLVDEKGSPIPGFAIDDCNTIHTNATAHEITWKCNKGDLMGLMGKKVCVAFVGDRAKLYSFSQARPAK